MDFQWVAIALGDVVWISLAFALGLVARSMGLPPLVGFLVTGFLLNAYGIASGEMLQKLSDLGITLLLFVVGLKLNLRTLARPQVWAVTAIHTTFVVALFGLLLFAAAQTALPAMSGLNLAQTALIAFALSFSSTVFVVKVLEDRGDTNSLHGRIAVGILIVQDLAAVLFLAVSTGKLPSPWAVLVFLLFPMRPVLHLLLQRVGHGELMVLYGFLLALGGAEAFELLGLKGDLGALVLGVLIANHPKAEEMAKTMLGFKDLFLLGFFLSIGLSGQPTLEALSIAALLTLLIPLKAVLFFGLFVAFKLRARTALLGTVNLSNYSEFGLIVAAIGVANGWIDETWMIVLAIALSLSIAIAAVSNAFAKPMYDRHRSWWRRWQRADRLADDRLIDVSESRVAIIGMGGVGTGAYDAIHAARGDTVVGIDIDPVTVRNQRKTARNVVVGDPSDSDFWDRMQATHALELVMLTLPRVKTTLTVVEELKSTGYCGEIAAIARFPDEEVALAKAGVGTVFNIYSEAGRGFASHVIDITAK